MSAWIVSQELISLLVNEASKAQTINGVDPSELGQMLWEENHRSINARYSSRLEVCPKYEFKRPSTPYSPLAVIKQIDCYSYQSNEHDGWKESKAHRFCEELKDRLISSLPEYDAAPWGI
jgi:hypothetical protein